MSFMPKRPTKIGNSLGVIIPSDVVKETGLTYKTDLEVRAEGHRIVIEPVNLTDHKIMKTFLGVLKDYDKTLQKLAK